MSYAVKVGTNEAFWVDGRNIPAGHVRFDGNLTSSLIWGDDIQNLREPNAQEIAAQEAAAQVEAANKAESAIARDDAKRALSALDTIIADAPTATIAQLRAAVEQMAQIQKHIILATLGR